MAIRYPDSARALTAGDPLLDLRSYLGFLTARAYVTSLLRNRHGVGAKEADQRAARIVQHARAADEFLEETLSLDSELAFLTG